MLNEYIANSVGLTDKRKALLKLKQQVQDYENNIKATEKSIKDNSIFDISIIDLIKEKYSNNYKINYDMRIIKSHNYYILLLVNNSIQEKLDYDNYKFWEYVENKDIIILAITTSKTKNIENVNKISFLPISKKDMFIYNRNDIRIMDEFEIELLQDINDIIIYKTKYNIDLSNDEINNLFKVKNKVKNK